MYMYLYVCLNEHGVFLPLNTTWKYNITIYSLINLSFNLICSLFLYKESSSSAAFESSLLDIPYWASLSKEILAYYATLARRIGIGFVISFTSPYSAVLLYCLLAYNNI